MTTTSTRTKVLAPVAIIVAGIAFLGLAAGIFFIGNNPFAMKAPQKSHLSFSATLSDYKVVNDDKWTALRTTNEKAQVFSTKGEPELYSLKYLITVPKGTQVDKVEVDSKPKRILLDKLMKPVPEDVIIGEKPLPPVPNPAIYAQSTPYPEKDYSYSIVQQANTTVLVFTYYPLKYVGSSNTIFVNEFATIKVTFHTPTARKGSSGVTKRANAVDAHLNKLVLNPDPGVDQLYESAKKIAAQAVVAPEVSSGASRIIDEGPGGGQTPTLITGAPADYLIIAPSAWSGALDAYVAEKTAELYRPRVFSTEDIYATYSGTEQREKIYNFIKDAFTNWDTSYVLLVGDLDHVPSGSAVPDPPEYDGYYTLLAGGDGYADIYLGRLPADSYQQAMDISTDWANYNTQHRSRSEFTLRGADVMDISSPMANGWQVSEINHSQIASGSKNKSDIINTLNSNTALVTWQGHGSYNGWFVGTDFLHHPVYVMNTDAASLVHDQLPFINAIASCSTGQFRFADDIGRNFITDSPSGGAIGYIGANYEVSLGNFVYVADFYEQIQDQYLNSGIIDWTAAYYQVLGPAWTYNFLGDPTAKLNVLPATPDTASPTIVSSEFSSPSIFAGQSTWLRATITDNDQVGLVHVTITDPSGTVTEKAMQFDSILGKYVVSLSGAETMLPGTYRTQITARDISQNEVTVTGPNLTITADTQPPVITDITFDVGNGLPFYQGEGVLISVLVTDNADLIDLGVFGNVRKPNGVTVDFVGSGIGFTETQDIGVYTVTATAEDASGNISQPMSRTFEIVEDTAEPVISDYFLTKEYCDTPATCTRKTLFTPNANIYLDEVVSDNSGSVTAWAEVTRPDQTTEHVGFFNAMTGMYMGQLLDASQAGTYSAVFYARDPINHIVHSDPLLFTVDDQGPSVTITAPAANAVLKGAIVPITAAASDNVAVAGVQFKIDGYEFGNEITTSPYSTYWNTGIETNGPHTLTAVARDTAGNTTTSANVPVTVDTVAPTTSITSPTTNAFLKAGIVSVTASASDNVAVAGVQFKLDGASLGTEDTTSPYSVSWDTTGVANGQHILTAVARDTAGNSTTSANVSVTVDTVLPTTSITQPANGVRVRGTTIISATASDATGIVNVEFYVNSVLTCADTAAPYDCSWTVPNPKNITYQLQTKAYDAATNVGSSAVVSVTSR